MPFLKKLKVFQQLIAFIRSGDRVWLLPIIFLLFFIGLLLFAAEGTVVAPFIYTIF